MDAGYVSLKGVRSSAPLLLQRGAEEPRPHPNIPKPPSSRSPDRLVVTWRRSTKSSRRLGYLRQCERWRSQAHFIHWLLMLRIICLTSSIGTRNPRHVVRQNPDPWVKSICSHHLPRHQQDQHLSTCSSVQQLHLVDYLSLHSESCQQQINRNGHGLRLSPNSKSKSWDTTSFGWASDGWF